MDIDWFAIDAENNILHFASGGGELPAAVVNNELDNDVLIEYFHGLPKKSEDVLVSDILSRFMDTNSGMEDYLRDFKGMAQRGLYSFDKSYLNQFLDNRYHLVCSPKRPILISELPTEIKDRLLKVKLNIVASQSSTLDISEYVTGSS